MASSRLRSRSSCRTGSLAAFPSQVYNTLDLIPQVADMSDKTLARDFVRVAKEETVGKPLPTVTLPPASSAVASRATFVSDPSRSVTRSRMKSAERPSVHRATHKPDSPHVHEATPTRLSMHTPMRRALFPSETTGSPVRASVNVASGSTTVTGRSLLCSSPRVPSQPDPTNTRMTALEHGMDEIHDALYQLTARTFNPPVHPDMAPDSPLVDLLTAHAPHSGELEEESSDYSFHHELRISFISPTSHVSGEIINAAQRVLDSMSEHDVNFSHIYIQRCHSPALWSAHTCS